MIIFHFLQFEHELFWRYFKRLNVFLTQRSHCVGKWESLDVVDEGVNNETKTLLEYQGFHGKNVGDAWYLLGWITWDSFEFEKASQKHVLILVHSMLDLIVLLFGVICVVLLIMLLICALIMHAILNLILHHPQTTLKLS